MKLPLYNNLPLLPLFLAIFNCLQSPPQPTAMTLCWFASLKMPLFSSLKHEFSDKISASEIALTPHCVQGKAQTSQKGVQALHGLRHPHTLRAPHSCCTSLRADP